MLRLWSSDRHVAESSDLVSAHNQGSIAVTSIKQFPFTPMLGWSMSRYDLFSLCKRKYYYHYYGKYDPEVPLRLIQELKGLTSVPLAIGISVHDMIPVLLNRLEQTTEEIDRAKFFDFAEREIAHLVANTAFHEVYYGEQEQVMVEDLFPKVEVCLENLLNSERYNWLTEKAIESKDEWVIEPPGYGETRMQDLKVYFKVDFLFPIGDDLHILDWKSGQKNPQKHRKQLVGYAAWASYHFEVEPEKVKPTVAYLYPEYEEVAETFNAFDLEHFAIQVKAETSEMYEYCRDVEQNIPVDEDEFPLVDDERICSLCNYRGLCFPDQYSIR
jgi:hypothetical protein